MFTEFYGETGGGETEVKTALPPFHLSSFIFHHSYSVAAITA